MVEIIGKPSDYQTTSSGSEPYVIYKIDQKTDFIITFVGSLEELNLVNRTKFHKKY